MSVSIMRSAMCGLERLSSTAAVMSDRALLMSWRMLESLWFNSSTCLALKVIGWLGKAITHDAPNVASNASQSSEELGAWCLELFLFFHLTIGRSSITQHGLPQCRNRIRAEKFLAVPKQ